MNVVAYLYFGLCVGCGLGTVLRNRDAGRSMSFSVFCGVLVAIMPLMIFVRPLRQEEIDAKMEQLGVRK